MRKLLTLLFLSGLLACAPNYGSFNQTSGSRADLSKSNYRILKTGVSGESSGFTLLWFIPIVSPSSADAKQQMYDQLKAEGIDIRGRSIALANVTEDRGGLNVIIFGIPSVKVTADIVEFTDEKPDAKSSGAQTPEQKVK